MKTGVVVLLAALASGCATSARELGQAEVDGVWESARSPQEVATCMAERLTGQNTIRNEGDHWWVIRQGNAFGWSFVRWDMWPKPGGGTRVELRSSIPAGTGEGRLRSDCL